MNPCTSPCADLIRAKTQIEHSSKMLDKVDVELNRIYKKMDTQNRWTIGLFVTMLFETAALVFAAMALMMNNG